eukprot:489410_1
MAKRSSLSFEHYKYVEHNKEKKDERVLQTAEETDKNVFDEYLPYFIVVIVVVVILICCAAFYVYHRRKNHLRKLQNEIKHLEMMETVETDKHIDSEIDLGIESVTSNSL